MSDLVTTIRKGRRADGIAAGLSALGLILSTLATLWFLAGFIETDPSFSPASSAFLLSLGLGAFAIIPTSLTMKLAWRAWHEGFQIKQGLWTLLLMVPWIVLGALLWTRSPLPAPIGLIAMTLSTLLCLWALISIALELAPR